MPYEFGDGRELTHRELEMISKSIHNPNWNPGWGVLIRVKEDLLQMAKNPDTSPTKVQKLTRLVIAIHDKAKAEMEQANAASEYLEQFPTIPLPSTNRVRIDPRLFV